MRKQKREDMTPNPQKHTDLTDKPKTKSFLTFVRFPFYGLHVLSTNPGNQALIKRLPWTLVMVRAKSELRANPLVSITVTRDVKCKCFVHQRCSRCLHQKRNVAKCFLY